MNTSPQSAPQRIHDLLSPWVASQPSSTALQDDEGGYTYAELDAVSQSAAQQLRDWGVRPGDRVLIVG